MGCDGGTIPKRDELVKTKKKPEQKDKVSELSFRWQHCSISQEPLKQPIVACGLGKFYNKDIVIEKLLEKSMPDIADHLKSLKDVRNLNLTINPAFKDGTKKGDGYVDHQRSPYICPMSGLEMNGKFKFCFSWACGCVFSERAFKQINEKECIICQTPFEDSDVVILNAVDEDLDLMKERLALRYNKLKAAKKMEKKIKDHLKNMKQEKSNINDGNVVVKNELPQDEISSKKADTVNDDKLPRMSTKLTGLKRSGPNIDDPAYKKTKSSYSLSKDPKSSNVYKSLFTTHRDAKSSVKAHWVTYNPFYN